MMPLFFSEKPISRKKFLHQLDPRVKLFVFTVIIFVIIFTPSRQFFKFMVYFLMLLLMIAFDRIPLKSLGKRLLLIVPLLIFLTFSVIIFGENQPPQKLDILWNIMIKSALCFLSAAVLTLTTEFYDLIKGLELLRLPLIVPSLLSFAYRYSFLFVKEAVRMNRAKESRSFGKRKKLMEIKIFSRLLPHLFFRTLERGERIYAAMLSRSYDGRIQTLNYFKPEMNDFFFIFLFLFILLVTWILL